MNTGWRWMYVGYAVRAAGGGGSVVVPHCISTVSDGVQ
jgi:hypothetical protein